MSPNSPELSQNYPIRPELSTTCEFSNRLGKFLFKIKSKIQMAPSHPTHLFDLTTSIRVEVVFLLTNTTSLVQSMDQGLISNFAAHYLRWTFWQLIDKTDGEDNQSITNFWKNYNIMDSRRQHQSFLEWGDREMFERSMEEYMAGAMQGCWHKNPLLMSTKLSN